MVNDIQRIFLNAHVDSEWYINPGESEVMIKEKRRRAELENSLQIPKQANTTFTK